MPNLDKSKGVLTQPPEADHSPRYWSHPDSALSKPPANKHQASRDVKRRSPTRRTSV